MAEDKNAELAGRERFENALARRQGVGALALNLFFLVVFVLLGTIVGVMVGWKEEVFVIAFLMLFAVLVIRQFRRVKQSGGSIEVGTAGLCVAIFAPNAGEALR